MNCSKGKLVQYKKNPSVVCSELEGGGILLNLATKYYFNLNETGLRIWQILDHRNTTSEIADSIVEEYDIDGEHAGASVSGLLQELEKNGLIQSGK